MNEFCKNLPKIELHAHLNGSLSSQTLKKLGCFDDCIGEYQKLNKLLERNSRTLNECFLLFKVAHNATRTKEAVYVATKDVIQEFFDDNVIYLELRTTPRNEVDMTMEEYVEAVVKAIQDNKLNIIVKLLLSIDRRYELAASEDTMNLIIKMKSKYPDIVKGVDLSGNPNVGIFNSELFKKAKQSGLNLSLHCGEVKNDKEVEEMLLLNPDRIGHATCIHPKYEGSDDLWNLYRQKLIPAGKQFSIRSELNFFT
ncbi:adenosine deaminase [Holotrichia oblita]|uniref:Adenosine deaminase n=1 Tax=Holotrichia oblita TaxID=644536 RepID=A0ACB9TL45_HOLOL|nr:adenosine deaminase [Holotrichia oblita]